MTKSTVVVLACLLSACSSPKKVEKSEERAVVSKKPPAKFYTSFDTTKGVFVIETVREWAPRGADRFYELVTSGFYDGSRFFRVRPKFAVQFGLSKDPQMNQLWGQLKLPDDPVKQKNKRGYVSFAMRGPASRTTQIFVNLRDNPSLDAQGFAPFGRVVEGLPVIENLYAGYGEITSLGGAGPDASKIELMGDEYVQRSYPKLDTIKSAKVVDYTLKEKSR